MREIALDTETTGFDPVQGHRIVEIGCVEMLHRVRTGNTFHTYLNPERDIPADATNVHGITNDFVRNKPKFAQQADAFLAFIGSDQLVIHNAAFDMRFLNAELKRCGKAELPMAQSLDTVELARRKFPGAPASLDALCKRFAIDLSARTKHGALLDAELLCDVYLELMGGRQAAMLLDANTAADGTVTNVFEPTLLTIAERHFSASEEEKAAHKEFLNKIKNPLWLQDTI